ncbi:MAG TPA: DUF1385 domain-containing protein [Thermoanaerobaculia bacterium]|nr:DUF1385 domain-containing protein [Thermoanaerobaculia bacterium]
MKEPETELLIGGQALIEGVLMRSPGAYGIAVRRPDGSLALQRAKVSSIAKRWPVLKLPILRGVAVLFQSLFLGIQALNFSALEAGIEVPKEGDKPGGKPEKPDASKWAVAGSMAVGLGLGVVIFLLVPLWLTELAQTYVFGEMHSLAFNLFDGLLRGIFFLAYIVAISRMDDIHRVFQYHGAEHKVVFAWESGRGLTVENARVQSRLHPRCGTSFLLFVLLVSIVLFALIPKSAPFLVKFGGRLVLVPLIAGLSYEVLRLTAKRSSSPIFRLLVAPGLALQRITTQEPTDDMLEVAIVALQEALREDGLLPEAVAAAEEAPALA